MTLFEEHIILLKSNAFTNIIQNDSFLFLETPDFLNEYLVPVVPIEEFDLESAQDLLSKENDDGKIVSVYISELLRNDYQPLLEKLGYSEAYKDVYLFNNTDEDFQVDIDAQLEEVKDEDYDQYLGFLKEAFPEWENEIDYTNYFHELSKSSSEKKNFKDFVLKYNSQIVSMGSIIIDKELDLAYIHNAATVTDWRRQGFFVVLNMLMCNYSRNLDVKRFYAVVTEGEGSYHAYKKLGFEEREIYYSYS